MSDERGYLHDPPGVVHLDSRMVVIEIGDEQWAMRPQSARSLYRHLGTVIGCLDGEDPDLYERHNREVREAE